MTPGLLSVVICTHDRVADLRRCLDAVAALEDDVEVIVVDSASSQPVADDPSLAGRLTACGARVVRVDRPGLSLARNAGIEAARGEIVAFLDDDAFPHADWAGRIAAPFARPEVACVGGTCVAVFEAERPRWLSDRLLQFAGATRLGETPRQATRSRDFPFGANMAFRRADLVAAGGFDEDLGRIGSSLLSGEESAVMQRLLDRGRVVWIEPSAVVDHLIQTGRTKGRWYWSRMWWSGIGRARMDAQPATFARMLAAVPVRLGALVVTRDSVYLFRLAETGGFLVESARRAARPLRAGRRRIAT